MSSEEAFARELISILVDAGRGPEEIMPPAGLRAKFGNERPKADYDSGIKYAVAQNWLTYDGIYRLTGKGHAQAR